MKFNLLSIVACKFLLFPRNLICEKSYNAKKAYNKTCETFRVFARFASVKYNLRKYL